MFSVILLLCIYGALACDAHVRGKLDYIRLDHYFSITQSQAIIYFNSDVSPM